MNRIISELDEKYLLGELLPRPLNEIELQYFNIMKTLSRSAVGEVKRAECDKDDYCQYVENWIHEMKTPLTACLLILENGGDSGKLRKELKRAENLTDQILYYARLKSMEKDTMIRLFTVRSIVEDTIKNQKELLIGAGISINVTGDFSVDSDDKALGFIMKQLLVNSLKYCPGCHITISLEAGRITYEDDGIGIPEHELSRVTERGFTGTNGRGLGMGTGVNQRKLGSSTGMSLFIVSELCKRLHIELSIESEEDNFTRICLSFLSLTKM